MSILKDQPSAPLRVIYVYLTQSADPKLPLIGITVLPTVFLSKNGGAAAAAAGTWAQISAANMPGWYAYTAHLSEVDTFGKVALRVSAAGAVDFAAEVEIVAYNALDAAALGLSKVSALPPDPADASDIGAILTALVGYVDTEILAIKAKTDLIAGATLVAADIPTASQIGDALLAKTVESTVTVLGTLRGMICLAAAKTNGMGEAGTANVRNIADTKNRITATLDSEGNRTAVVLDLT